MPLQRGAGPASIVANIGELVAAGHQAMQAAAIAYEYEHGTDRAAGILFRCGDSVLLLLRRAGECDCPLTWAFPGGSIEEGETPEQAAIREVMEETGYTPTTPLLLIDWLDGFSTFLCDIDAPFVPVLNHEHLGFVWVPLASPPAPMHPGCAVTLQRAPLAVPVTLASGMDARTVDGNGWFEVRDNPISKVGVFPYSGRQLGLEGADADRIFQVYRPEEELSDPECVESFKLLPWVDEHAMLGPVAQEMSDAALPAERKGVQGVLGESVYFKGDTLFANLKAFSSTLAALIKAGKRELSAGYRCIYEMTAGVFNGQRYDAVQRKIRGNHIALVAEGRMGPGVAVMDHKFVFSLDTTEAGMADEKTAKDAEPGATGGGEMTMAEVAAFIKSVAPQLKAMQEALAGLTAGTTVVEEPLDKAADKEAVVDALPATGGEGSPEGNKPASAGMDEAAFVKRIAKRDQLARQISAHIGTFDHSEMTLDGVVAYGCEKLGIKGAKAVQSAMLEGYLQAKPAATPAAHVTGMDEATAPAAGSFVSKFINNPEA